MRGDLPILNKALVDYIFQFTPLREGRHTPDAYDELADKFQFTPLREGRPPHGKQNSNTRQFQFTPLREGRLAVGLVCDLHRAISIHAPA